MVVFIEIFEESVSRYNLRGRDKRRKVGEAQDYVYTRTMKRKVNGTCAVVSLVS
jgi:hypothetical protein